jgi:hypothetical protein
LVAVPLSKTLTSAKDGIQRLSSSVSSNRPSSQSIMAARLTIGFVIE